MGTPAPYLVEEILEEIFLRLPTPTTLVRVSTACASFRRIITARPFLRRFRELHPPPLLGFAATNGGFNPVQEPHPSAPLARALAEAADFSYSYVPKPGEGVYTPWSPCDVRDGRVLLLCDRWFRRGPLMDISRKVLAVCDPLSRRYVLVPPVPWAMVALQQKLVHLTFEPALLGFEPVLAPSGEDEDETSFRVICWANYKTKFVMFVFSSATGKWCVAASSCWSSFGTVETSEDLMFCFNYFRGNLYWTAPWGNKLLVFDTCSMEFSTVNILTSDHMQLIDLPDQSRCISSVVAATEGALEMFTLVRDHSLPDSYHDYHLYHTTQKNNDHSSYKCELVNFQALPRGYCYYMVGVSEGFVFLRGLREIRVSGCWQGWDADNLFLLDVKTFELMKVHGGAYCSSNNAANYVQPYFGFPPSLSKPSL
ncbi:unnamed protein product [Alopecurus aequalis]